MKIDEVCAAAFADPAYATQCNWFVWKVCEAACARHGHGFGERKDRSSADTMIGLMRAGNGWTAITGADPGAVADSAIRRAQGGALVIAGMTSTELQNQHGHGHLAVVIGVPGEPSGAAGRALPCGYAGSENPAGRIPKPSGRHMGWTFPVSKWAQISYWYRLPDAASAAKRGKRKKPAKKPAGKKARRARGERTARGKSRGARA